MLKLGLLETTYFANFVYNGGSISVTRRYINLFLNQTFVQGVFCLLVDYSSHRLQTF